MQVSCIHISDHLWPWGQKHYGFWDSELLFLQVGQVLYPLWPPPALQTLCSVGNVRNILYTVSSLQAGEAPQQLRALAAPPEDLGLVPAPTWRSTTLSPIPRSRMPPGESSMCAVYIHTQRAKRHVSLLRSIKASSWMPLLALGCNPTGAGWEKRKPVFAD